MPNIRIIENDQTSPGTPGSYANYAVLIAGYVGEASKSTDALIVKPDSNGVYEFSSQQAFIDTIGKDLIVEKEVDGVKEYHYGYRMARELLGLGYPVIYKPIEKIADMDDYKFWNIFNDKASYDFRFISHGLLETNYDSTAYVALQKRAAELKADLAKLAEIEKIADKEAEYARVIRPKTGGTAGANDEGEGYTGFINSLNDSQYETYEAAVTGVNGESAQVDNQLKEHDARYVTPTVFNNINGHIAKLASYTTDKEGNVINAGRGDCVALIELDERKYVKVGAVERPEELIIAGINAINIVGGEYCAMTVPSVYYADGKDETGKDKYMKMPGAFHYLACFINSLSSSFAEWYAAAGYTRGVSNYSIHHTSVKLGEIAINALEPRYLKGGENNLEPKFACNVIANFRGSYYLWGNRTAYLTGSENDNKKGDLVASHFLNIRQLCTTVKKQLYVACRRFTFDPNSDTLWFNFVNAITPTLDAMKADQGIRDYKIMKVPTDRKATLKAKIRIIPIEAVEDFDIEVSLEDSFGGVSVNAN